jgi:anti-sigma factor RsiW
MLALRSNVADQKISQGVLDAHLRALVTDQPITVASSDRHTVKPWFNGRIAQSPAVVDLSESGFQLIGGRIDVVDATPVATVVYKRRLHLISVVAIPDREGGKSLSAPPPIKGYNRVEWNDGETAYWAISDLNAVELRKFSQLFKESASRTPKNP